MKEYTDITILLDRSGSMSSIRKQMESGLKELFLKHREVPSTRVTLVQFDTENPYEEVFSRKPVSEIEDIKISPRGGTPLIDALCNTIDRTGMRFSWMKESERPDQVLFIVITDGEENSSRQFKKSDVKSRIETQKGKYNWQFMFLGADENSMNEAISFGISRDMSIPIRWVDVNKTADAFATLGAMTASYTSNTSGMRGLSKSLNYTEEDRAKLENVTTNSTGA